MKKRLILIAAICLAAALFALPAAADGEITGTCGDGVTWAYAPNERYLQIFGSGEITDPTWRNNPAIADNAVGVSFLDGEITSICDAAFPSFTQLKRLYLPDSLVSIGESAFSYCSSLEFISFGESLEVIEGAAFSHCPKLTNLDFSETSLVSLGGYAFYDCANILAVNLPLSLSSIGDGAFAACESLSTVNYDGTIDEWGDVEIGGNNDKLLGIFPQPFGKCGPDAYWEYDSTTATITIQGTGEITSSPAMLYNDGNNKIVIEEGITSIGESAFDSAPVSSVTMPSTLESIGTRAFYNCLGIQALDFPDSLKEIGDYAFSGLGLIETIELPEGLMYIGTGAFGFNQSLSEVSIPGSVKQIGSQAFMDCPNLSTIEINEGVEIIGKEAFSCSPNNFYANQALTSMELPESIKEVGEAAFKNCTNLETINLPDELNTIGSEAFSNTAVKSIDFPASLHFMGTSAFSECTSLETVAINQELTSIPARTFYNCTSLTSVNLPDTVTSIGDEAFSGCSGLETLTVGEFVNSVGGAAFYGCEELTLRVCAGSYMQAYAEAYDIDYELIPGTAEDAVGIASITSARGVDTAGKACTVVTITLTNGETEVFYVYDGEQGEPGEPGEIIVAESFSDVAEGAYYSDAVAWAVAKGITTGTGAGTFSPDAGCTRGQIVTFLFRAAA